MRRILSFIMSIVMLLTAGVLVGCNKDGEDGATLSFSAANSIEEMKKLGKPFVVVLNSNSPRSTEVKILAEKMELQYQVPVLPMNCEQLKRDDILTIFEFMLKEFQYVHLIVNHHQRFVQLLGILQLYIMELLRL